MTDTRPEECIGVTAERTDREVNGGSYIDQILATPMEYPIPIVQALKHFKRNHKLGNESNEARLQGMRELMSEISVTAGCQIPALAMEDITGENSGGSEYVSYDHKITMRGKLSIITFLHECAHAIYGYNEHMARVWSIKLFKQVYPKAYARLHVVGAAGFFLSLRTEQVTRPVVSNGHGDMDHALDAVRYAGAAIVPPIRITEDGMRDANGTRVTLRIAERSVADAKDTAVEELGTGTEQAG